MMEVMIMNACNTTEEQRHSQRVKLKLLEIISMKYSIPKKTLQL